MADSTAQGQTADSSGGDDTAGCGQAKNIIGMVDIAPGATATDRGRSGSWINPAISDRRQINHQSVVRNAKAGGIMASASDGNWQPAVAAEINAVDHVRDIGASRDHARLLLDHRVVNLAGVVVLGITRLD